MKRKFNFTGRRKIVVGSEKPESSIALKPMSEGRSEIQFKIDTEAFRDLPEDTAIILEAWYRTSYDRYELGTLGAPSKKDLVLEGIEPESVRFNIKLVGEHGRLLARAASVKPVLEGEEGVSEDISLIGVQSVDMQQMWRLKIDEEERPVLEVNKSLNLKESLRSDPQTRALVFPAMLRELSIRYLTAVSQDLEPSWGSQFKSFAESVLSSEENFPKAYEPLQQSEQHGWIERFVEAFCNQNNLLDVLSVEEDA